MILETILKYRVMKAINTLSVLFFLFIAVACSSESDTIMNDLDKDVQGVSEMYASVDFSFLTTQTGVATKASELTSGEDNEGTDTEQSISNCYIAVFEYANNSAGKFLGSRSYDNTNIKAESSVYKMNGGIIFKIPENINDRKDLLFVAIANVNAGTIPTSGEMTYDGLMDLQLTENPTALVKVGEKILLKGQNGDYTLDGKRFIQLSKNVLDFDNSTKSDATVSYANLEIPVKQRTAAIMLKSFEVNKSASNSNKETVEATITNVSLENVKMYGKVNGENTNKDVTLYSEVQADLSQINDYRFYAYENTSTEYKTKMHIDYEYKTSDSKTVNRTFSFTIKSPEAGTQVDAVWANHLYEISVTITNEIAKVDVQCYTKDWEKGGSYEVTLKPSTSSN